MTRDEALEFFKKIANNGHKSRDEALLLAVVGGFSVLAEILFDIRDALEAKKDGE